VAFLTSDRWADTTVHTQLGPSGKLASLRYSTEKAALALPPDQRADVVFLATPPEASKELAPRLLDQGCRVIDLSNAYRVNPEIPSVYGLPELFRSEIADAKLLANPGCYPTAASLALAPFFARKLASPSRVIVDAASGVSGAGRAVSEAYTLMEMTGDFRAYKVLRHQHTPELVQTFGKVFGAPVDVTFTPHLLPIPRGILATCYAAVDRSLDQQAAYEVLVAAYAREPFVTVVKSADDFYLKQSVGTNHCVVGASCQDGTLVVIAAIDNLIKGAAGQAVQNLNLMLGLPETTGLEGLRRMYG
jgi:N-acetyl-gamma-glutamyl-phosphate reductase